MLDIKKKYQVYNFLSLMALLLVSHKNIYASSAVLELEDKMATLLMATKPLMTEEFNPVSGLEIKSGSEKYPALAPLLENVATVPAMRKFLSISSLSRLACVSKEMPQISSLEVPVKMYAPAFIKGAAKCPEVFKEVKKAKLIFSQHQKHEELMEIACLIGGGQLTSLRLLDLEGNNIGAEGVTILSTAIASGNLLNLRGLLLGWNNIRNEALEALMGTIELGHLPNLRGLHLDANNLGVAGAQAISRAVVSGHLPNLVSFHLNNNSIGLLGSQAIADAILSGNLSKLKSLQLHMKIAGTGRIGIQMIVDAIISGKLPNLYELFLDWNLVTIAGIQKVSKAVKEGKLPNFASIIYYKKELHDDIQAAIDSIFEEPVVT